MPTGPDGLPQEDRTARAGPRYAQGALLLDRLLAGVPAGYTAEKTTPGGTGEKTPGTHQADFTGRVDGVEVWSYMPLSTWRRGRGRDACSPRCTRLGTGCRPNRAPWPVSSGAWVASASR